MEEYDLEAAQEILGHRFNDPSLLQRSLCHASVAESRIQSNERLEFLGDAILGMLVCERIFERFPGSLEGEMTKIKSLAVSRSTCTALAEEIGLDSLIVVGKGMRSQKKLPASLAAAVLESSIAALYLDGGMEAVSRFLVPLIDPYIDRAEQSGHQQNFKSVLQQHAQQAMGIAPIYKIIDEKGPDHAKAFRIAVAIRDETYEPCWGQSKKEAEQQAAMQALQSLGLVTLDEEGNAVMAENGAPARDSAPGPR